jgi:aminoglycoside phosphotransferase
MAATATGVYTRHRHRLEDRGGRRAFAKLAADAREAEELRWEAEVLGLLGRRCPATARLAPACLGWSEKDDTLYLEAIEGEDLAGAARSGGGLDVEWATALGSALTVLHEEGRAAWDEWPGRARSGPVGVHRPTPADMHGLSAAAMDALALLQRSASLCAHLDRLCVPPRPETLVHGDVRLENVIAGEGSGLRLIDWECAGVGEALWDVALFIASCLGAWLSSTPQIPGVSPDRLVDESSLPLAAIRPGLRAFWLAYVQHASLDTDSALHRCVALAAVRLVQLGVEAALDAEDLRAVPVLHFQLAHNMLERPDEAAVELLGVPPRDG